MLTTLGLRYRFQRLYHPYKEVMDLKIYFFRSLVGYVLLHSLICYLPILLLGAGISLTAAIGEKLGIDQGTQTSVGAILAIALFIFCYTYLEIFACWLLSDRRMIHMVKHQVEYKSQLDELKIEHRKQSLKPETSETVVISQEPMKPPPAAPQTSSWFDIDNIF
ncbi:MAG: hypothetical protein ACKO63_19985 [Nodosilinea sp.]